MAIANNKDEANKRVRKRQERKNKKLVGKEHHLDDGKNKKLA